MNSRSLKLYERAMSILPDGTARDAIFYRPYPVYAKSARGSHIWDENGNERIDYCFNFTSLLLGHQNPHVIKAVQEQLENAAGPANGS